MSLSSKMRKRSVLARGIAALLVGGGLLTTASNLHAQIIWSGGSTEWTTGTNWIGGVPAGSPITTTNTDIALFSNNTNTTVGINMNTTAGVYYLGAIEKTNSSARTINNNSTTPGILTLNGATVNSVANTILHNNSTSLLTITNGATTGTLGLELGNATNNIIQITNTGGITIASIISGAGRNLTKQGFGTGVLTLSGINTYSGTTTISGGVLAANSSALGDGSATNTLVFNGGTLRATGAITSAATRGVTMTSTGIIDNNGFAVSIAGNMTGAGGLIKYGSGTLTLSGTNNYAGATTVNAGTLQFTSQASLYNSTPASWTAANINVKAGSTFAVNVDSAGTAGFTASNLATLLTNISVANNAASGLQAGAIVGIDTSTATGGTFSLSAPLTNSTGASGGAIGLTKFGVGTLVLDQANTYTGPTAVLAGTLQLDNTGAISPGSLLLNGILDVNKNGSLTQGTNFPSTINGSGALNYNGTGTLTLNAANLFSGSTTVNSGTLVLANALALRNSALVTTGAGVISLSGPTTLTLGGLSGATGDLATTGIFNASYATLTSLTLNPLSGTATYGGAITNGAAGMSLTKTGTGTQVLQGVNTYSGATSINTAIQVSTSNNISILELSGSGSILNSAITMNGGQLRLTNTAAETGSGRVSDTIGITAVAGTINYNNTSGTEIYAEMIGSVALTSGHLNIVESVDQLGGGSQTLTLAGLTRTGATNTSTVAFSAAGTAPNATTNIIKVSGATGPGPGQDLPGGVIIGPWATTGTSAFLQTDYAVYDASGNVVPANITPSAETTWTSASRAYTSDGFVALSADRSITALRNTGTSATITLSDGAVGYTLATNGILSANNSTLTIAPGNVPGQLTAPGTSGGQIYINTGGSRSHSLTLNSNTIVANLAIDISASINDNGGPVTVVKAGENSVLRLTGTNNYSGGTVINSGILLVSGDGALGAPTGDITLNGGQLRFGANSLTFNADRDVIVGPAGGILAPVGNQTVINFEGKLTGSGSLRLENTTGAAQRNVFFNSTSNDFTGEITVPSVASIFRVNSFADPVGAGDIILYKGMRSDQASFEYGAGAIAPLTLNNRSIQIVNDTGTTFSAAIISNLNATQPITVNTDLISLGATARFLQLTSVAGPTNVFAGKIPDGNNGGILSITKTGTGNWTLSGDNTYSGTTTISAGTLQVGNGGATGSLGSGAVVNNASLVVNRTGTLTTSTIDGTGTTDVTAMGANLTANYIRQTGLLIGDGNTVAVATNGGNTGVSQTTNLTIGTGGKLDLKNNDLVVKTGSLTLAQVETLVNSGALSGSGILTSSASAITGLGTAQISETVYAGSGTYGGLTVADADTLVKYTYLGDADLSGSVDFDDYAYIDAGFFGGGNRWAQGDFDNNGVVDFDDYAYIDGSFFGQGAPLLSANISAVPEPSTWVLGSLAMLGLAGAGLRRRRVAV